MSHDIVQEKVATDAPGSGSSLGFFALIGLILSMLVVTMSLLPPYLAASNKLSELPDGWDAVFKVEGSIIPQSEVFFRMEGGSSVEYSSVGKAVTEVFCPGVQPEKVQKRNNAMGIPAAWQVECSSGTVAVTGSTTYDRASMRGSATIGTPLWVPVAFWGGLLGLVVSLLVVVREVRRENRVASPDEQSQRGPSVEIPLFCFAGCVRRVFAHGVSVEESVFSRRGT